MALKQIVKAAWYGSMLLAAAACQRPVDPLPPLPVRLARLSDKFFAVAAFDPEHAIVAGYGGKVLRTADAGKTWRQVSSGVAGALFGIHFSDTQRGWICGQDGVILHTEDGGQTWEKQISPTDLHLFAVHFSDSLHGWAVGDKSVALATGDGGRTWRLRRVAADHAPRSDAALATQNPVFYAVYFADSAHGWISGEFGKLLHTDDGGRTWLSQEQTLLGDEIVDALEIPTFFGMHFTNQVDGIAVGVADTIATTSDGATWKLAPHPTSARPIDVLYEPHLFADGSAWVIGGEGVVLRREAGQSDWRRVDLGADVTSWLRAMAWADNRHGWMVGGHGLILHTEDGGETWARSAA